VAGAARAEAPGRSGIGVSTRIGSIASSASGLRAPPTAPLPGNHALEKCLCFLDFPC